MIYENLLLTVKHETDIDQIRDLLTQQGVLSREEPGCARFEVYQSQAEPQLFMLIERWETANDLSAYRKAKAFREIFEPLVLPLVDRTAHTSELLE